MLTGAVEHWIGNAAAVLSGAWGAVTRRAEHSGYSRTTLYTHTERVVQAVASEQARGLSYEALWAQNAQLQADNAALWQAWGEAETLSESTQRELASAGSAMGLSLTQIVTLLAIVLPMAVVPSRATVGRWVQQSAAQSSRLLRALDRACQRWVLTVCLDEIFFHRTPILMAVEPVSLVWLAGQRGPDRSGASWGEVIEQWPSLEHVIADGGTGLEKGVKLANERRRAQTQERDVEPGPPITMGLDVFHSQREMERVLQRQWKQAERQVERASEADAKVAQYKRRGRDARGVAGSAGRAWRKAERLFDEAVHMEEAVRQIETALVWFDAEGQLLSRTTAQQQLDKASEKLSGSQWSKVRRLLKDERSLGHLDRLEKQLAEGVAEPQLREALTRLWVVSERLKHAKDDEVGRWSALVVMEQVLCGRLCPQWQEAYRQVDELLRPAVRASSAVEGVNSVVRMHQGRHRHVSQGMLNLKRLYWNCRVFRDGKRKGRSPYDLLGLKLPNANWWQLLQMDPEELEQNLLTQELAA
jgi:hypothetical protein